MQNTTSVVTETKGWSSNIFPPTAWPPAVARYHLPVQLAQHSCAPIQPEILVRSLLPQV